MELGGIYDHPRFGPDESDFLPYFYLLKGACVGGALAGIDAVRGLEPLSTRSDKTRFYVYCVMAVGLS